MALIECKECGKELSSEAISCPHCGRPNIKVTASPKKISWPALIGLLVFGAIGVTTLAGYIATHGDSPPLSPTIPAAPTSIADSVAPQPAETADDDKPRSRAENAQLYSNYVGQIQTVLFVSSMMTAKLMDKLKEDYAFARLDAVQQDLQQLDQQVKKEAQSIIEIRPTQPIDEAEYDSFSSATAAASDLVSDDAELVLDLAAGANYGSTDTNEIQRIGRSVHLKRQAFEAAVYEGYKHFGYKRGDIDKTTLTLNAPDRPPPSPAPVAPLANFSESFRPPPAATR
jgi:hypothetical protein